MNNDLKIIKKKYGEKMMHLCRELFSTILDNSPGILPKILLDNFYPSHDLYDDLVKMTYVLTFKKYLYNIYENIISTSKIAKRIVEDPITLMKRAGYALYECKTEEDIQKFKKYYTPGETLCTFNGARLDRCYVYFAVKDNAFELNRHDFPNPNRQDEYGTSVISIQFTRDDSHMLSIKNRYNHTVSNPDATYNNNLDNIIPGLTQSFADYYGMKQSYNQSYYNFDFHGYVKANDGKFYKCNFELNNKYFCPGNIVIDNFQVIEYPRERYLLVDYFLIDLVNKKVTSLLPDDCFPTTIKDISKINITNCEEGKLITIIPKTGDDILIKLDKYNRITSYTNNNVRFIGHDFLCHNTELTELNLDNVESIGNRFMPINHILPKISLPNVLLIGDEFLSRSSIIDVYLPRVKSIGYCFLSSNYALTSISLPEVETIGAVFLGHNWSLKKLFLPNLRKLGSNSLSNISMLAELYAPQLKVYSPSDTRLKLLLFSNRHLQPKDNYQKIR